MVETAKLRNKLGEISEISGVTADFGPAHELLQEFGRESKALADLARSLGAEGVFLAKYGYEKIDGTTAQFVIPRNCPRLEILQEAQGLAVDKPLIRPAQLLEWAKDERFTRIETLTERICIDGHVVCSRGRSKEKQFELLRTKGLEPPRLEDLVVAFALHWVATGQSLFGWFNYAETESNSIRASGGVAYYQKGFGLSSWNDEEDHGSSSGSLGISARIFPESKA